MKKKSLAEVRPTTVRRVRFRGPSSTRVARPRRPKRSTWSWPSGLGHPRVLLISSNEIGQRARQHEAAVAAAVAAGVGFLAYTSILHADRSTLALAAEHRATEAAIAASGLPYALLRNGWYLENDSENLGSALQSGVMLGSAGEGKVAAASRRDFAEAAAAALTGKERTGAIFELAGDEPFTMRELARVVSDLSGKPVAYQDMPEAQYREALTGFGVPAAFAEILADSDAGIARGELDDRSGDLRRLIGRPTTPLRTLVAGAVAAR